MFSLKLDQFEGPLDLLLELIEAEKLDITSVALAGVTDAYLAYVEAHPEIPPEELADFLVVASKLLYLKSKTLLPVVAGPEEEIDLESQLRIYKEYVEAAKKIEAMAGARRFMYVHDKAPKSEIGFAPPQGFTAAKMKEIFAAAIKRLEPLVRVPQAVLERVMSIHEKIRHIQSLLANAAKISFSALAMSADSRADVVVSFLALLELIKQRGVEAHQPNRFDDIVIAKRENAAA